MPNLSLEERGSIIRAAGDFISQQSSLINDLTAAVAAVKAEAIAKDEAESAQLTDLLAILEASQITAGAISPEGELLNPTPATDAAVEVLGELPVENTESVNAAIDETVGTSEPTPDEAVTDGIEAVINDLGESAPVTTEPAPAEASEAPEVAEPVSPISAGVEAE